MTITFPLSARGPVEQHLLALEMANRHRRAQADLKRNLKALPPRFAIETLAEVIADSEPPVEIAHAKVYKLLLSCPRIGEGKASRAMKRAGASESKRLSGLTPRQRVALSDEIREMAKGW